MYVCFKIKNSREIDIYKCFNLFFDVLKFECKIFLGILWIDWLFWDDVGFIIYLGGVDLGLMVF